MTAQAPARAREPQCITSNAGRTLFVLWLFALVWNGIAWPVGVVVIREWQRTGAREPLLGLLFPGIGLALLLLGWVQTSRWLRFGRTVLNLDELPVGLGTALTGTIATPRPLPPVDGVRVVLECARMVVTGAGSSRSRRRQLLWQDERFVAGDALIAAGAATRIPVRFTVPCDCPATDTAVVWTLRVEADLPGADLNVDFTLPVQQTEAGDNSLTRARVDHDPARHSGAELALAHADSRIRLARRGGTGVQATVPPVIVRRPGLFAGLLGFCLVWTGAVWFLATHDAPLFFPIVFGTLELVLVLALLDFAVKETRIRLTPRGLERRHRRLFLTATRQIDVADLEGFGFRLAGSGGSGTRQHAYYTVNAHHRRGGRTGTTALVTFVPTKAEAQWLTRVFEEHRVRLRAG